MLGADRIFIGPKVSQPLVEKRIQPAGSIGMGHGVMKRIPAADTSHTLLDQLLPRLVNGCRRALHWWIRNNNAFGQLLAVIGIKTPAPADWATLRFDQQIQPLALHLVEATHQGLLASSEVFIDHRSWGEQHRCGDNL